MTPGQHPLHQAVREANPPPGGDRVQPAAVPSRSKAQLSHLHPGGCGVSMAALAARFYGNPSNFGGAGAPEAPGQGQDSPRAGGGRAFPLRSCGADASEDFFLSCGLLLSNFELYSALPLCPLHSDASY